MTEFSEEILDLGIDYDAEGGHAFDTEITEVDSGREDRNKRWSQEGGSWQVGERYVASSELYSLNEFHRARHGRWQGFRWRDWADFEARDQALTPDGSPTVPLVKNYTSGSDTYARLIKKPRAAGFSMQRNASAFSAFTLDTTTGVVTLQADASAAISNITQAAQAQVEAVGHGYSAGDEIHFDSVGGMTEINDQVGTIQNVVDADHFTVDIDTSGYSAYTSGGTADKYVQSSESLTWSGEFDVPVRFDTDKFNARFDAYDPDSGEKIFYVSALSVVVDKNV